MSAADRLSIVRIPAAAAAILVLAPAPATARVLEFVQTVEGARLVSPERIAVSPDGRSVYVGGGEGLDVFARDASGALRFVEREEAIDESFVLSPDGRHLYSHEFGHQLDRLTVWERDPVSGRLSFAGSPDLSYEQPRALTFSPEGLHLYTSGLRAAVHVLERDPSTGALREVGELPMSDDFRGARVHAASPDGRNVYAATTKSVTVLARDRGTGALSVVETHRDVVAAGPLVGLSSLLVSPDGMHVYATVFGSGNAIAVFEREPFRGALRRLDAPFDDGGLGISGARQAVIDPSGTSLYLATVNEDAVLAYARDDGTGFLSFAGTIVDGEDGADGLDGATALALSHDARDLYATGYHDHAVARLEAGFHGALTFAEARFAGDEGFAGLDGAFATSVSPDGAHLYVAAAHDRTIAALARDPSSGALTPIATYEVAPDLTGGPTRKLTLSPGGEHLYVTYSAGSSILGALAVFARDPDGTLSFVESHDQDDPGFARLVGAGSVLVSPDGRNVYVGGSFDLLALARDAATGSLAPVGSLRLGDFIDDFLAVAVSPDGRHLYATSHTLANLTALARDETTGTLETIAAYDAREGRAGLDGATAVAVSPDGRHVYVASMWDGVTVFARDAASGELAFVDAYFDGDGGVEGLAGAQDVAVSPGGELVYVAGTLDDAVAVFARHVPSGRLSLLEVHRDEALGVDGLRQPTSVTVSPDGRNVHLTSLAEDAVAVFRRKQGPCADAFVTSCLGDNRFRVELEWRDFRGVGGTARRVPFGSDDSGLFWFFGPDNWEMMVKVIDGCSLNDRYWVFAAATTNVAYTLRVTDVRTGILRRYTNPLGRSSPAITDTDAFATCPPVVIPGPRRPAVASGPAAPSLTPSSPAADPGEHRAALHPDAHVPASGLLMVGLAGKCLDVQGGAATGVTPVHLFRCHAEPNQRWELVDDAPQVRVRGLGDRCLQAGPEIDRRRSRAVVGPCGESDRWRLEGDPGAFRLVHVDSGRCLDVENGWTANRTPVQLFECHGGANQTWRLDEALCRESPRRLCLNRGRFEVEVEWGAFAGNTGRGRAVPFGASDSGLFWFFREQNWEVLVKVVDGCATNRHYWVFAAATTNVEYTLRVTDTRTGESRKYANPLGAAADAVTDTTAFATCP